MKVKWITLENEHATASLKQHAFIAAVKKVPYTGEEYNGNEMLCTSKGYASDDGELATDFELLEFENFTPEKACKKCLKHFTVTKS